MSPSFLTFGPAPHLLTCELAAAGAALTVCDWFVSFPASWEVTVARKLVMSLRSLLMDHANLTIAVDCTTRVTCTGLSEECQIGAIGTFPERVPTRDIRNVLEQP